MKRKYYTRFAFANGLFLNKKPGVNRKLICLLLYTQVKVERDSEIIKGFVKHEFSNKNVATFSLPEYVNNYFVGGAVMLFPFIA